MDEQAGVSEEELAKAAAEVRRRETKLTALDEEITRIRFGLDQMNNGRALRSGNAALIGSSEAFRRDQRERLFRKLRERQNLLDELQRAQAALTRLQEEGGDQQQ